MEQTLQPNLRTPRSDSFGAPAGAGRDTIININHTEPAIPTAPIIMQQPQAPAYPQSDYGPRMGGNIADVPQQAIEMKPVTKTTVNWGAVVKGALIVTGVVVAGVVGWWALSTAASWALATPLGAGVASALTPAVTAASNGLAYLGGFLTEVPGIIGSFFSGIGTGLGLTSAATGAAAAAVPTGAITSGAGAIGLGAGLGVSTMALAPQLGHLNLTQQTTTHVANLPDHAAAASVTPEVPHQDGGLFHNLFSSKSQAAQAAAADATPPDMPDTRDAPPSVVNASAVQKSLEQINHAHGADHMASELSHHAAHGSEHHASGSLHLPHLPHFGHRHEDAGHADVADANDNSNSPDMPDHDEAPTSRRRNWRDRMMGATNYQQAFQSTGSHGAAIRASQSAGTPIQPRASEFSQALHDDRMRLEASLADNNR